MKNYRTAFLSVSAATLSLAMLSGCQPTATAPTAPVTSDTMPTSPVTTDPTIDAPLTAAPAAATAPLDADANNIKTVKTPKADNGCYVHLFDDDNYGDDNDVIYGPGKFTNLKNLEGATESDWGGDADSLKVGPKATVKAFEKENYAGKTQTFGPNTQKPKFDIEIKSMEISCN